MNVKEAVQTAKAHIAEIFEDEKIARIGLEEVEFDSATDEWRVTIGFNRPWDADNSTSPASITASLMSELYRTRAFKVVRIKDDTGEVCAISDRLLAAPA